jgi:hypothetical protein
MLNTIPAIPHIQDLKYSRYDVFSYQPTYSLDYPRLIPLPHLEVADVTVPGCGLNILQCFEAPALRSVRLDGWREYDYAEEWVDVGYTPVSASLKRLPQRAPNIRRLDLHCIEFLRPDTYDWLFSQTDFGHLEELRIEGSTITDTAFIQSCARGCQSMHLDSNNVSEMKCARGIQWLSKKMKVGHKQPLCLE